MKVLFCFAFAAFAAIRVQSDIGDCSFDTNFCSCKHGGENQGKCWDRTAGTPAAGQCTLRFCKAGWVCACQGRTHLCPVQARQKHIVDTLSPDGTTATCHEETSEAAGKPVVELGNTTISISREGLLNNACNELAWWHNGQLMSVYGKDTLITAANIDSRMELTSQHTLMEFQPGDLLAFRFKNASYFCFNSYVRLTVNGTNVDTSSTGVSATFARAHSNNWYSPSFTPVFRSDESTAAFTEFLPLRTNFISTGLPIQPEVDYWAPPDGSEDHKLSNFYFRIQL